MVTFGNVRMTFRDTQPAGSRKQRRRHDGIELEGVEDLPPPRAPVGDALIQVAPIVARRKKSFSGGIVVVAALALVGGGVWFWLEKSGGGPVDAARPVEAVAGNLIPGGYSFEGDDDTWSGVEGAPAAFLHSGSARRSGAFGASADVDGGQWALYRSPAVRASAGRELTARGFLRTRGLRSAHRHPARERSPRRCGRTRGRDRLVRADHRSEGLRARRSSPSFRPDGRKRALSSRSTSAKDAGSGSADADDVSLVESQARVRRPRPRARRLCTDGHAAAIGAAREGRTPARHADQRRRRTAGGRRDA